MPKNKIKEWQVKPWQVKTDPAILNEFYRWRITDPETKREYAYLCTQCSAFVPPIETD